ncbi:hypothetical protein [Streptomyces malaysiensis]|uniref:Uncharacterized protein n=1 Tax=Streptomyces malaysiensis subsp. samsunensis TaxID=459658 RepID=A0A9X2M1M0_STRMQ|nr:hypothetical protein [Streptomyces samsunensis]MCQ8833778.1 hypothetical protein [Streptomyces samsunensis]
MTTASTSTATTHPGQVATTSSAPGYKTCGGRRARRLDSYGRGRPRSDADATMAAIRLGDGAHVHFSLVDDCFAVVRAVDPHTDEATA